MSKVRSRLHHLLQLPPQQPLQQPPQPLPQQVQQQHVTAARHHQTHLGPLVPTGLNVPQVQTQKM